MIHPALEFISDFMNKELALMFGLEEDAIALGSLSSENDASFKLKDKIVMSLMNIEQELTNRERVEYKNLNSGSFAKKSPPIHLNLYLMFASNHSNDSYLQGVRDLNALIGIIQSRGVFLSSEYPSMDQSLDRLSLELHNISLHDLSNMWSAIGTYYRPSVMYRLRLISIDLNKASQTVPEVTGIDADKSKTV